MPTAAWNSPTSSETSRSASPASGPPVMNATARKADKSTVLQRGAAASMAWREPSSAKRAVNGPPGCGNATVSRLPALISSSVSASSATVRAPPLKRASLDAIVADGEQGRSSLAGNSGRPRRGREPELPALLGAGQRAAGDAGRVGRRGRQDHRRAERRLLPGRLRRRRSPNRRCSQKRSPAGGKEPLDAAHVTPVSRSRESLPAA